MNEADLKASGSVVPRAVAALICMAVGSGLLAIATFDPLEFRGNFLTVLCTLGGAGFVLGGIALLTPRVARLLIELFFEIMSWR